MNKNFKNEMAMDDVAAGMFITIFRGRMVKRNGEMEEERRYKGHVLKAIAVDMPFVAIEVFVNGRKSMKDTLDLREVVLKRLSDEFVKACVPNIILDFKKFDPDLDVGEALYQEMGKDVLSKENKK